MKKLTVILCSLAAAAAAFAVDINPWQAKYGHRKAEPALVASVDQLSALWEKADALSETDKGRLDTDDSDLYRVTYKGKLAWTFIVVKLKYSVKDKGFQLHWEAYSDPYKGQPCEFFVWDPDAAKFVFADRGPENTLFIEARASRVDPKYWVWDTDVQEYVCTVLIEHHNVDDIPDFIVDVVSATY